MTVLVHVRILVLYMKPSNTKGPEHGLVDLDLGHLPPNSPRAACMYCTKHYSATPDDKMFLREPHGNLRELRVQWADEGESPSALAQLNSVGHELWEGDDEADSSEGDCGNETWPPPPQQASIRWQAPSLLQQTLPTSPPERRHWRETSIRDDDSEDDEDWRYNDYNTPSCNSENTCNETYSGNSSETSTSDRKDVRDRLLAVVKNERGTWGEGDDEALVAAPVHASSSLLSPMFSPLRLHEQACKVQLFADYSISDNSEPCPFQWRPKRGLSLSPPLSPEVISVASTASRLGDETRLGYSARSVFVPSDLRPRPSTMSRSKSIVNRFARSTRRLFHHSSTAVHEPRARCGCRGLTVRVDSGLLGLSLEARYRIEHGLVLKQAWSDCTTDKEMFSHSVHVQHLPNEKANGHSGGAFDLGFESRSSSSGLIRVRAVDPGSGDARTTSPCKNGSALVGSPPPLRPGALSAKDARRMSAAGVLEVEEGDILVRVDDVQVRTTCTRSFTNKSGKRQDEPDGSLCCCGGYGSTSHRSDARARNSTTSS